MQWFLLALIVISLFLIAGRFPKVAFAVFVGLLGSGALFLWITSDQQLQTNSRVSIAKIKVDQITVVPAYGGSYRFTGRIYNHNTNGSIKQVTLRFVMQDCDAASECDIIGQESERITTPIPASQARDFNATMYFGKPQVSGELEWQIEVTEVRQ